LNAELPRMQMPGLDFDHTLGLLASPTISDDIDGLLVNSDFPATNAVAPVIHNHSMTPTPPPPFISHQQAADDVQFHVKTKTVFICAYGNCNKEFGRKPELYRHHRSVHKTERPYKCRDTGCLRAVRGFPRADKRDDHERKVHGLRGSRGHGFGANAS
jgi:hypothetical protein